MKQSTQSPAGHLRRVGVAEAKSQLSQVLRRASEGPTVIHRRGRDLAVVLAMEDYERLLAQSGAARGGGASFLDRVAAVRQRHGGGADFVPERLDIKLTSEA